MCVCGSRVGLVVYSCCFLFSSGWEEEKRHEGDGAAVKKGGQSAK